MAQASVNRCDLRARDARREHRASPPCQSPTLKIAEAQLAGEGVETQDLTKTAFGTAEAELTPQAVSAPLARTAGLKVAALCVSPCLPPSH